MTFTVTSHSFKDGDYLAKTMSCRPTSASAAMAATSRRTSPGRALHRHQELCL